MAGKNTKTLPRQKNVVNTNKSSDKYLHYLILSGILILTLIIYRGTLKNGFINWDDDNSIINNKNIQNLSFSGVVKDFSSLSSNVYEPIIAITDSVIYYFFGLNPTTFHSINIFFHLLNIILVYLFIYQLTSPQNTNHRPLTSKHRILLSAFIACLFAIHPMHAESVCWISGLDSPLYSFFYLASLIFYLKYIQSSKYTLFNLNYWIALLFFFLSLLTKSMAVTLPIILILLDYYTDSSEFKVQSIKYWLNKIPFFLLTITFSIITIKTENFNISPSDYNKIIIHYSLINRFFLMTYSVSFYIITLVFPIKLSAFHPSAEILHGFLPYKYYLSPILIILIIAVISKMKKARKELMFGTLFFLITISITLIAGNVRGFQVAERYTYIPYLGLFFIIGRSIRYELRSKMHYLKYIISILFILIFSFISNERTKVWANNLSFFDDMVKKYPTTYIAFNGRGLARDNLADYAGALDDFNKAIKINPANADLYNNRGISKAKSGDMSGALQDFNRAIELKPQYAKAYNNRGNVKYNLFDYEGAILDYDKVIEQNPQNAEAYISRGNAKYNSGDKSGGCSDWRTSVELGYKEPNEMIEKYCK
jgi:protein O-mannosyl-transferase